MGHQVIILKRVEAIPQKKDTRNQLHRKPHAIHFNTSSAYRSVQGPQQAEGQNELPGTPYIDECCDFMNSGTKILSEFVAQVILESGEVEETQSCSSLRYCENYGMI
jgi:hypothetical protein